MAQPADKDSPIFFTFPFFDDLYPITNFFALPFYAFSSNKYNNRVAPGGLHLAETKSMYQVWTQFYTMDSATKSVTFTSKLFQHFILMIGCTLVQPLENQCYNNVFADTTLNGGYPKYDSPYGFVDWYTWQGWFEAYGFHIMMYGLKELLMSILVFGIFMAFQLTNPSIPFCVDGDVKISYVFGYIDVCKYLTFLQN